MLAKKLGVVESEKSANVTLLVFGNSRIDSGYIKSGNGMVLSSKFLSHNSHERASTGTAWSDRARNNWSETVGAEKRNRKHAAEIWTGHTAHIYISTNLMVIMCESKTSFREGASFDAT